MKGLKVEKKQIPLVLGLLAVIAAVLVYFQVYQKYLEKTASLESANSTLQGQIDDLKGKVEGRGVYESEAERMQLGIKKVYDCFPPMLEEEDGVMEAMRLEALAPMRVYTIDFSDPVTLYVVGSGQTDGQAAPAAEDTGEVGETTLEEDVAAAQAGETTNYGELQVPELNFSAGVLPAGYQGEYGPIALNVNVVNYNFETSYEGLKRTFDYFISNPDRRTIQSISIAQNENSLLSTSMIVNEYSLTGTGKVYEYPNMPAVSIGTSNIFGSNEFASPDEVYAYLRGEGELPQREGQENQEETETQEEGQAQQGRNVNKAGNLAASLPTVVNPTESVAQ